MEKPKNRINIQQIYAFSLFLLFLSPVINPSIRAQSQKTWHWVRQMGSKSWDISAGVASDSKNNLFVTGSFYDTLNTSNKKIVAAGNQDIFVAIFNEKGILKELNHAGGRGNDLVTCSCITSDDNLAIGGIISDSAMFEKKQAQGFGRRLFVSSIDNNGRFKWVSTISFTGDASLYIIGSNNQGSIFASGFFDGILTAGDQKVVSTGKKDIFIVLINKSGLIEKLFSFGGDEDDSPGSLSADASGNFVVSGVFGKSFETNGLKFNFSSNGTKTNAFIAMFDTGFKTKWVNTLQGEDFAQVVSMKQDISGNLYATGNFISRIKISDTILISNGFTDAFLLKYKPDGKLEWGKQFGSWYYDYTTHLNLDNLGGTILTGTIGDTTKIDSLVINPVSKNNSAFVVQFSPNGKSIWADCISGTGRNFSNGSTLDKQGNLYFTGSFQNKFEKESDELTSLGDQDIFLAKYYNCPTQKAEIFGQSVFCPGAGTELSVKRSFTNVVWNDTIKGKYSIIANKPGKYNVSMLDKKGCLLTDTVIINQNQIPYFSLGNDTTLLIGDSLILHAPLIFPEWLWKDYTSGPDYIARTDERIPGIVKYWLSVTDSLSCNYSDTISVNWLKNFDWVDLDNIQLITYPNPTDEKFYWYLKTEEACQLVAELADNNGRILYHQFFRQYLPGEVKEISLGNMPSGFYNMRISNSSSGKLFKTVRVIKK